MTWAAIGVATVGAVAKVATTSPTPAGAGMGFTTASAASYGTTLGNDGWSINMGSGTQVATPTESNSASYPQEQNPLTALQPRAVLPDGGQQLAGLARMDTQTLLLLGLGGLVLVKAIRR